MGRYFEAKIKENLCVNEDHNLLSLVTPEGVNEHLPGQFYMIEVNRGFDPLLKRAFSLFRKTSDGFQILYRIKGKGTSILKDMKKGTFIDVLGPLGKPYPNPLAEQTPVVVAGGIGIASVFSLIERLSKRAYVFYGARSKDELFMIDELRRISKELVISTDDGSYGEKATVIDSLNNFLSHHSLVVPDYLIYACGPKPMLKKIAQIAILNNIKAYVSLEENMACGVGACQGCVVRVRKQGKKIEDGKMGRWEDGKSQPLNLLTKYKRVCKEGPVFNAEEIIW